MMAVATKETRTVLKEVTGIALHECKPYQNRLRYLPRFSGDQTQRPSCANCSMGLRSKTWGATVHCHQSRLMIVSEIGSEEVLLTHPKPKTTIMCPQDTSNLQNQMLNLPGALKINLPRQCQLNVKGETMIQKRFLCKSDKSSASIKHILPAAWTNLKRFVLKPTNNQAYLPTFHNFSECLNSNWTTYLPHFNLSSTKTLRQALEETWAKIPTTNIVAVHSGSLFHVFMQHHLVPSCN